jgi:metal-dependent amidase/aminoacylase/carboxypeptidase family protein
VNALQTYVTRTYDLFDPVLITVGTFHAGTAINIIPDTATFEATIRSFSEATSATAMAGAARVVEGIAAAHGVEVEIDARHGYPVTVNTAAARDTVESTVREHFGEEHFVPMESPLAGAEDFSRVLGEVPGAMVLLGATAPGLDPATAPNNHSALAQFDDRVLADGAALLAALALDHVGPRP